MTHMRTGSRMTAVIEDQPPVKVQLPIAGYRDDRADGDDHGIAREGLTVRRIGRAARCGPAGLAVGTSAKKRRDM